MGIRVYFLLWVYYLNNLRTLNYGSYGIFLMMRYITLIT